MHSDITAMSEGALEEGEEKGEEEGGQGQADGGEGSAAHRHSCFRPAVVQQVVGHEAVEMTA